MTMGYRGKVTNWGREVTATQAQVEREAQFGEMPGEVVSFDPVTQTGKVQPLYEPLHNGQPVKMPVLDEVPFRFPRAGQGAITFPVEVGDKVSLRPQMRSTENYHDGSQFTPSDTRSFALSDMEAYMDGGERLTDPIKNFDPANTHIRFDPEGKYGVRGSKDGQVKIEGRQGNIYDLLTQVVELLAADGLNVGYGSSAGTGHALQHRSQYAEIAAKLRDMALD